MTISRPLFHLAAELPCLRIPLLVPRHLAHLSIILPCVLPHPAIVLIRLAIILLHRLLIRLAIELTRLLIHLVKRRLTHLRKRLCHLLVHLTIGLTWLLIHLTERLLAHLRKGLYHLLRHAAHHSHSCKTHPQICPAGNSRIRTAVSAAYIINHLSHKVNGLLFLPFIAQQIHYSSVRLCIAHLGNRIHSHRIILPAQFRIIHING